MPRQNVRVLRWQCCVFTSVDAQNCQLNLYMAALCCFLVVPAKTAICLMDDQAHGVDLIRAYQVQCLYEYRDGLKKRILDSNLYYSK